MEINIKIEQIETISHLSVEKFKSRQHMHIINQKCGLKLIFESRS